MGRLVKRWGILVAVVVFLTITVSCWLFVFQDDSVINQATCDKIELGWSAQQVNDLLHEEYVTPFTCFEGRRDQELIFGWADYCDDRIVVHFERAKGLWTPKELSVTEKRFVPSSLSFAERLKRRMLRKARSLGLKVR